MPAPNQAALEFLLTRRSRPAKTLKAPVPDEAEVRTLLTIAARTPDHGKLEPWRFLVLEKPALDRLAGMVRDRGLAQEKDAEPLEKSVRQFADADLAVAVVASPKPSPKVPEIEQVLSAGAACYGLLAAALAAGWGANWLTGWASSDRAIVEPGLGLKSHEFIAGFIHIGTETFAPPERPRPTLDAITEWVRA
jgi:nitroreductase